MSADLLEGLKKEMNPFVNKYTLNKVLELQKKITRLNAITETEEKVTIKLKSIVQKIKENNERLVKKKNELENIKSETGEKIKTEIKTMERFRKLMVGREKKLADLNTELARLQNTAK